MLSVAVYLWVLERSRRRSTPALRTPPVYTRAAGVVQAHPRQHERRGRQPDHPRRYHPLSLHALA
eukprot:10970523-Alexandrium_andersonii.AAC.1